MNYWWLVASPKIWRFSKIAIGETQSYTLYSEKGKRRQRKIFQNFLDAKAGDLIICYESNPAQKIVALGRVTEQNGEKLFFEKTEDLSSPIDYATLKNYPELANMEFFKKKPGSLFALTKDEYDFLLKKIRVKNPEPSAAPAAANAAPAAANAAKYKKADYLEEVYMSADKYDSLAAALKYKKNIILQGAPGVGKTFAARRLAWSIMGEKDNSRIEFVQFHQSYSYEEFVMGYRPVGDGFQLKDGVFSRFCKKAKEQPDKDFFFIIDEINRGNLSKIFGELLMLIEEDHRGEEIVLPYDEEKISVPENLYIIGMMNTADRSLALIDYALRRRFGFFELEPAFDSPAFTKYQTSLSNQTLNALIDIIKVLNKEIISKDPSLGKGFCIGHSYFCGMTEDTCTTERLKAVVNYEIIPTLREYWYDNTDKFEKWEKELSGVFK